MWVFKAFLALDVPLSKLYVIYDQHFKAKVSSAVLGYFKYLRIGDEMADQKLWNTMA